MLLREIEDYGFQIGSRAVDWLNMVKEEPWHYNSPLEIIRFVLNEVWFFVFPGEVSPEELQR